MPGSQGPSTRDLCRWGALAQAVRDLKRGYDAQRVAEFVRRRFASCSQSQAEEIIAAAKRGIMAGLFLSLAGPDQRINQSVIPDAPR